MYAASLASIDCVEQIVTKEGIECEHYEDEIEEATFA